MVGQYNPLLLSGLNDVEDMGAGAIAFAPGVWWNPQLDPGNNFGALCSESAFGSADSDSK